LIFFSGDNRKINRLLRIFAYIDSFPAIKVSPHELRIVVGGVN